VIAIPDPDRLMAGSLGQWLSEQRRVREAAKSQAKRRTWNAMIVLLPTLAAAMILIPIEIMPKLIAGLVILGLAWAWAQQPVQKAKKAVKIGINEAVADALGLSYIHDFEPGEPFELTRAFGLVPSFQRSKFEDLWQGDIDGQPFALHEAKLDQRRGSGKNRRWVTVFKGAIISIGFSRTFHGTTLLQRAGKHRSFFGGTKDSIEIGGIRLDHVDLVHPKFADAFAAWSTDQVEARYLIHPAYVERLIAIEQAFTGKNVRALFHTGVLIIAIESGDMFESGSIDAEKDREKIEKTCRQFETLATLARSLDEGQPAANPAIRWT